MDMTVPAADTLPALHQHLIDPHVPQWLRQAPASTHAALRLASRRAMDLPWLAAGRTALPEVVERLQAQSARHHDLQQRIAPLLERLGTLQGFAEPRLVNGIKARFGLEVDVRTTHLLHASHARTDTSFMGAAKDPLIEANRALKAAIRPLLDAALQNFQVADTEPGAMDESAALKARVFDSYQVLGPTVSGTPVAIAAHEFAALARLLDLGGQYQAHIDQVFTAQGAEDLQAFTRSTLLLELHIARLQRRVDADTYQAVLALVQDLPAASLDGQLLVCSTLRLWDVELDGILLIGKDRDLANTVEPVLVYIPDDPVMPLRGYPSTAAFHDALRQRLLSQDYADFFSRFIPARHRSRIVDTLHRHLYPSVMRADGNHQQWLEQFADPQARLHLSESRLSGPLFETLYKRKLAFIKDNARVQGVPTADQDLRSVDERLAWWRDLALNTLNVAAFAVPVLGEIMLAATAAQLGYEVFEGIESWTRGEQDQALGYLVDVIENLAMTAALGSALAEGGRLPAIEAPEPMRPLRPVTLPDGRTRLWKPDLTPFAHDIVLPAGLTPDASGLVPYQGKRWLVLDGQHYSVQPGAGGLGHVLEHPHKAGGYRPALRHNGDRAWLHELDQPGQMQGLTLVRRLGYDAQTYPDALMRDILTTCDLPDSVLRQALNDHQRPPALLADTAERFRLAHALANDGERFQRRYLALQTTDDVAVQALQAQLPAPLPKPVAEEILAQASAGERAHLIDGAGVPLRLAEEARLYRQQVRLARAYEGLYLSVAANPDTDRLALHSLEYLPGWSANVRLEVRDGHFHGPLSDSIGAETAPVRKVLVRYPDGYEPRDADNLHLDGRDTLFAAILHALPDAQRQALGVAHVSQGADLQALIRQRPLPRRQARSALGMQPVKPGFRSPMRLADGRIGYPLSGRGHPDWAFTRESLVDKIRLLEFEDFYPEDLYEQLLKLGLDHAQIDARLNTLLDEQMALRASLARWSEQSAAIVGLEADTARLQSRTRMAEEIWTHWRMNSLPELQRSPYLLVLHTQALEDFPAHLPAFFFERVTRMRLENVTAHAAGSAMQTSTASGEVLERFLRQFSNVQSLAMLQNPLPSGLQSRFPDLLERVVRSLPQLTELGLPHQGMLLSQAQLDVLQGLPHLRSLDLSGNRFSPFQSLDLSWLHVDRLVLERTGLDRWPAWLDQLVPARVRELSLAHNQISTLPQAVLDNAPALLHRSHIDLRGNPLSEGTRLCAWLGEQAGDMSLRFTLDMPSSMQPNLDRMLEERHALVEAIEGWVGASSSNRPLNAQRIADRQRIGEALLDYWHAYSLGTDLDPLVLESIDLADFPRRLPAFMGSRVRALHLNQVNATVEQLDELIRRFPRLSMFQLNGHVTPLVQLPRALSELRELNTLGLIDQGLNVDQSTVDFLARLPALEMLELDGNRLGEIHDVSGLRTGCLRWLSLRNTDLQHWPQWILDLLPDPLEALILSNNRLQDIPESLLANPRSDHQHCDINLLGNPLSQEHMLRAHVSEAYNRTYSFLMDVSEDIRSISWHEPHDSDSDSGSESDGSGHRHGAARARDPEPPVVGPWQGEDSAIATVRAATWERLAGHPDSRQLLDMVGQLRHTADYRKPGSRTQLIDRVWRVLDAADQDPALRATLDAMAEEPLRLLSHDETCPDGVILEFNQMEVMVFTGQALRDLPGNPGSAPLLQLARRLYRLQALDDIARAQAGDRDEAEVRLAYRLRWAQRLELPVPPQHMLYQVHAELRPGELDSALAQVMAGEQGDAFLQFAASQRFWTDWLREHYAERFEHLEQGYRDSLMVLTETVESLNDPAFGQGAQDLQRQHEHDQQVLIKALTNREAAPRP
ncbi:NEL-type E3 ubiquitin ligase domain-containing protein [Pseudomonas ovata]|uniref:NEL-type E3 ubiquitin ligase domain-containing protein n=1 Tax=Pseudomonas ovata TaxID=1839709 RepID=UPI000D6895F3|nr:NEL-type E3 ubiquitin ligase domain-containing protein [Pseudomonas ovata]